MKILNNLDLTKNQLLNAIVQLLSSDPASPSEGQIYANNSTHKLMYHNGTAFQAIVSSADKNIANGVCPLDASSKVPIANIPDSLLGQVQYQGVYDASGGSAPSSPSKGYYWVISVAGTINSVSYAVGDWLIYNGTSFDKVDNTDAVTMVAGRTGSIILTTADVAASTDKNYVTDAKLTVINNTTGTNSGNETTTTIGTLISGATAKATPIDADNFGYSDSAASNVLKKFTFANMKAALKTYFDTLYNNYVHPSTDGSLHVPANGTTNNGKYLQATATAGVYQWATVAASISKYSTTIGDGASTSIAVTHALNTRNVVVSVFETASPYAEVITDIVHTDLNNVTISFTSAPSSGQYTVVVIG